MKFVQSMHAAPQTRRAQNILALSVLLALSACGGGGGGGNGGGNPTPTPPTPPATVNQAPTNVQAGADQTIQLPANSVSLSGSATDPEGATLTYAWTASPSGVTFDNAAAASTTATFAAAGTYTITLTASDGSLTATDTVQVTVQEAATPPANQAPVASAGADQTITFGTTTATLTGTAQDDNLPNNTLSYTWSTKAKGVSIATASAATTQITLPLIAGTYEFTLTVSDGALSSTDTVALTVNAATLAFPGTDEETDPNHGWVRVDPAAVGMDVTLLDQAKNYSLVNGTAGPGGIDTGGSGVIVRHGRLVYSWGDIDDRYQLKSATKSVAGIALGLALDDKKVGLRDTAKTHMATFGVPGNNPGDPQLDVITLLQLATHTAGFPKDGGFQALQSPPGSQWFYSDGSLNWLSDVLTQVYAQDLRTLLQSRVLNTLKISLGDDLTWRTDDSGRTAIAPHPAGVPRREFASGIAANTNAMARIGLLFLARGDWNGTRVISESFVDTVRTPQPEIKTVPVGNPTGFAGAPEKYGVLWWTNTNVAGNPLTEVPADAYWAWGLGDSLIVVIPSKGLVIARTGNNPDVANLPRWRDSWNGDYTVLRDFLTPIVKSIQQ